MFVYWKIKSKENKIVVTFFACVILPVKSITGV